MSDKLSLRQILACVDMNYKNAWKEFNEEERKSVNFWLLNRYVSLLENNYKSPYQKYNRIQKENAIIKTNERYNKRFNDIGVSKDNGHRELMWQLLCTAGGTGNIENHSWIGFKKRNGSNSKAVKLLQQIYPHLKEDEVETLAGISTKKELKQLAEEYGIEGFKL